MLYGDFAEAKQTIVKVNFSGDVLKALVEVSTQTMSLTSRASQALAVSFVRTLLSLINTAAFFGKPGLCQKAHDLASVSVDKNLVL
jgi:hypothetical protein